MEKYNKDYEELGITILNSKPDFDRLEAGFHFRLNNCTVPAVNVNIFLYKKWKIIMYNN